MAIRDSNQRKTGEQQKTGRDIRNRIRRKVGGKQLEILEKEVTYTLNTSRKNSMHIVKELNKICNQGGPSHSKRDYPVVSQQRSQSLCEELSRRNDTLSNLIRELVSQIAEEKSEIPEGSQPSQTSNFSEISPKRK